MKKITDLKKWKFRIESIGFEKEIELPHTWNVDEEMQVQLYRGEAEYSTETEVSELENKTAILYFGCVYHTANVYVNNRLAGVHTGSGYTPFQFDITDCLKQGKNVIKVVADNKSKADMLPYNLNFDWADDGGIIRNVVLSICDKTDIFDFKADYVIEKMSEHNCDGRLNITVAAVPQQLCIELVDCETERVVMSESAFVSGEISLKFQNLKLWNTDTPSLYIVRVKSGHDEIEKRIGFRTIEVKGGDVLLNGVKIRMKGCEWMPGSHPDYGMAEPLKHSIKCLSQLKDAGCVFTRFHWQQDTSIFDWCDENGLLVQEEIPYWGYPKKAAPLQLELAKKQAEEMVHFHSHHPSIICWGVGNELGGEAQETIDYVEKMYAYFKSLDNSRLVNYVSNTVSADTHVDLDDAAMHGDIAMWNEYLGTWQPCDDVESVVRRTYNKFGNMPSIVTEFGLCEPYFKGGDERRAEILRERIPIYKKLENMAGYVWFSLNDYRTQMGEEGEGRFKQRVHGSTDLYGNKKNSYDVFARVK